MVLPIYYKDICVGRCEPDIIIDDHNGESIIIELKAITRLNDAVQHQIEGYMRHANYPKGVMLNFSSKGVESKTVENINYTLV
jgi:GxxExxY protein